jgi:aerobic carbon-monoxide dehydrogenase medium subunit
MRLPNFDYHEPGTLDDACRILAQLGTTAKLIAGGTDLMVNMKKNLVSPANLISLSKIDELKQLETDNGRMTIGSCVTVAELIDSDAVNSTLSALGAGARSLGSPLVRNRATIGGNLGSARPAADLPPSLMAYGATVVLKSGKGQRTVSLDDFFVGPGLTEIGPDEILTEIRVNVPPPGSGAGYLNLGLRKTQDCNVVNVGSFIALDDRDGSIQQARVIMGCVGPTHLRSPAAEKILIGEQPDDRLFERAGAAAAGGCTPIDDFRGSAGYKRDMVAVLTKRTLKTAHHEALGKS